MLLLAGCAGEQLTAATSSSPQAGPPTTMSGRWFLAAPNAPPCGINFSGANGAPEGRMAPEGGCPGRFFLSRRWSLAGDALTISEDDGQPLGTLKFAAGQFDGEAVTGMKITLAR
ncbi:AprI/Inh family metalloprotease inhibitor [Pseudolabrys taiwanensis]|nr:AprI/Inh family metalloprotease inhibitor [Pseudolabrys taiwanensis]